MALETQLKLELNFFLYNTATVNTTNTRNSGIGKRSNHAGIAEPQLARIDGNHGLILPDTMNIVAVGAFRVQRRD